MGFAWKPHQSEPRMWATAAASCYCASTRGLLSYGCNCGGGGGGGGGVIYEPSFDLRAETCGRTESASHT